MVGVFVVVESNALCLLRRGRRPVGEEYILLDTVAKLPTAVLLPVGRIAGKEVDLRSASNGLPVDSQRYDMGRV